jgi:hypothetical protein
MIYSELLVEDRSLPAALESLREDDHRHEDGEGAKGGALRVDQDRLNAHLGVRATVGRRISGGQIFLQITTHFTVNIGQDHNAVSTGVLNNFCNWAETSRRKTDYITISLIITWKSLQFKNKHDNIYSEMSII